MDKPFNYKKITDDLLVVKFIPMEQPVFLYGILDILELIEINGLI